MKHFNIHVTFLTSTSVLYLSLLWVLQWAICKNSRKMNFITLLCHRTDVTHRTSFSQKAQIHAYVLNPNTAFNQPHSFVRAKYSSTSEHRHLSTKSILLLTWECITHYSTNIFSHFKSKWAGYINIYSASFGRFYNNEYNGLLSLNVLLLSHCALNSCQ